MFYLLKGDYRVRVWRLGALGFGLLKGLEWRPQWSPVVVCIWAPIVPNRALGLTAGTLCLVTYGITVY